MSENCKKYASGRWLWNLSCHSCGGKCVIELFKAADYRCGFYLTGVNPQDNSIHRAKPCPLCARMIIQAGIKNVYLGDGQVND